MEYILQVLTIPITITNPQMMASLFITGLQSKDKSRHWNEVMVQKLEWMWREHKRQPCSESVKSVTPKHFKIGKMQIEVVMELVYQLWPPTLIKFGFLNNNLMKALVLRPLKTAVRVMATASQVSGKALHFLSIYIRLPGIRGGCDMFQHRVPLQERFGYCADLTGYKTVDTSSSLL